MIRRSLANLLAVSALAGCAQAAGPDPQRMAVAPTATPGKSALATFAGGCFWCMEPPFDSIPGVLATTSGYAGGSERNPTYEQVSAHQTGHAEVVQVLYEPSRVSYEKLLDVFWRNVDPTVKDRQFCDAGRQYRTAIFVHDAAQRAAATASLRELEARGVLPGPIATEIVDLKEFWPAEEYHQDFYRKNPERYRSYRKGCGRDARLKQIWGEAAGH